MNGGSDNRITARALVLGGLFAACFAILTVYFENRRSLICTANQIPVLPYVLLLATVLLLNPLFRLIRVVRRLTTAEILVIFTMGMVSSGISTFGLSAQLVPVIGNLFNGHWNTEQTEWNRYVEPFLNEQLFISVPGIRQAAREYRAAAEAAQQLKTTYEAALARQKESAAGGSAAGEGLAGEGGGAVAAPWPGADPPARVVAEYPDRIREQERLVAERKAILTTLEDQAKAKVALFRRGLPKELRAYPGFLPMAGDDGATYAGRLGRLFYGKRAAGHLRGALAALRAAPAGEPLADGPARAVAAYVRRAIDALAPLAATETLDADKAELDARDARLTGRLVELDGELVRLNEEKRRAAVDAAKRLERRVARLERQKRRVNREKERLAALTERKLIHIEATRRVAETVAGLTELHRPLAGSGARPAPAAVRAPLAAALADFPQFDASLRRYFVGDVPWSQWAGPLVRWGLLIALTYVVLMTFNILIFRQWAHNEKLIYPLAELPEILAGFEGGESRGLPAVFRSGLFWLGVSVSAVFVGWNLLCRTGVVPGLKEFDFSNAWQAYIQNTALAGLEYLGRSTIFFTMIGLAFLIPKKVSFSLWFFYVLFLVQVLVLVWTGYGYSWRSFPWEWWYTLNFCNAEGGGALLVFASVVLFKCRRYLLCVFWPASVRDLEADERRELRIASGLFLFGSLGVVGMLWRCLGANLYYSMFAYAIIMVITIGLVRAVAEGGVLGFQAWVSPFHFVRHVFGFDKSWSAPSLFAPLMVYYSILFLDIKTFIAPAMANSLKIRDDLRMARGRFHAAMAIAVFGAALVAVVVTVMMCYAGGADAMNRWFYVGFPRGLFARIADIAKTPPTATSDGRFWLAAGIVLMAALLYFRQRIFWLPHPIGLIMLVNPIMKTYWFSIFVGWIAKTLVTKYGNKDTYVRARGFFVGLIVGELVIVTLAMGLSYAMKKYLNIDLNRN
ncbi:MAG: hypothetical protein JXR37_02370 [Kiritimatiellae bacterium]|nr:hypothetical protein [Kiritimatiellia bacterium]